MKNRFIFYFMLLSFVIKAQNQLAIPGTLNGTDFQLELQNGNYEFYQGHITSTMGVNGNILGPTLILNAGDMVNMHVTNNIGEVTTIHWHGLHVSSENDGGPHIFINPGQTWSPSFTVLNRAGTYWYHPHLHEHTDEHVSKGIAGMIIIKDSEEASLDLPRTYGVDDIPLVIQTKHFDSNYQIDYHANNDDTVMVNATVNPEISLPAQVIRLRLLDGSSQRVFRFGFTNNMHFYQIATDGGLLDIPNDLTRLQMASGERAEILVDLTGMEGQTIYLKSFASEFGNGIYGATNPGMNSNMTMTNYSGNLINGSDFNILKINVGSQTSNPVTSIPTTLSNMPSLIGTATNQNRSLTFRPVAMGFNQLNGDFTINDVSFDMNTINITVPLNNVEKWTVTNSSAIAHPFHIHDVQFQIISINGNTNIPAYARGWKDTFLVPAGGGSLEFITKFEDFSDDAIPYMYHCHMLTHEDGGMMGGFTVVDTSGINDVEDEIVALFPNPIDKLYGTVKLYDNEQIISYSILDMSGKIIRYEKIEKQEQSNLLSFSVENLSSGEYLIKIYTENSIFSKKFVKK